MIQFLNSPDDCQWLRDTALRGVDGVRPFNSFVLYGNEDAPDRVDLYTDADPLYRDTCQRIEFDGDIIIDGAMLSLRSN